MNEIVLIAGYPACGKSTLVESYKDYVRFNRDLNGGKLTDLIPLMEASKSKNMVLDNLFGTKEQRKPFIDFAKKNKIPIRCIYLDASLEDAQYNACIRMIEKTGKILTPEDHKNHKDPNLFQMAVLYSYRKTLEMPTPAEGFVTVEKRKFIRKEKDYTEKALILDFDGCLRETIDGAKFPTSPKNIRILPGRTEVLKKFEKAGYHLLGVSNQSGIAKGDLTMEQAIECFDYTNKQLGVKIDYAFCPHKVPPISCYCRKPGSGLGVQFIEKYKLDRKNCIFVVDMTTDKTFAAKCGFQFFDASEFTTGGLLKCLSKN